MEAERYSGYLFVRVSRKGKLKKKLRHFVEIGPTPKIIVHLGIFDVKVSDTEVQLINEDKVFNPYRIYYSFECLPNKSKSFSDFKTTLLRIKKKYPVLPPPSYHYLEKKKTKNRSLCDGCDFPKLIHQTCKVCNWNLCTKCCIVTCFLTSCRHYEKRKKNLDIVLKELTKETVVTVTTVKLCLRLFADDVVEEGTGEIEFLGDTLMEIKNSFVCKNIPDATHLHDIKFTSKTKDAEVSNRPWDILELLITHILRVDHRKIASIKTSWCAVTILHGLLLSHQGWREEKEEWLKRRHLYVEEKQEMLKDVQPKFSFQLTNDQTEEKSKKKQFLVYQGPEERVTDQGKKRVGQEQDKIQDFEWTGHVEGSGETRLVHETVLDGSEGSTSSESSGILKQLCIDDSFLANMSGIDLEDFANFVNQNSELIVGIVSNYDSILGTQNNAQDSDQGSVNGEIGVGEPSVLNEVRESYRIGSVREEAPQSHHNMNRNENSRKKHQPSRLSCEGRSSEEESESEVVTKDTNDIYELSRSGDTQIVGEGSYRLKEETNLGCVGQITSSWQSEDDEVASEDEINNRGGSESWSYRYSDLESSNSSADEDQVSDHQFSEESDCDSSYGYVFPMNACQGGIGVEKKGDKRLKEAYHRSTRKNVGARQFNTNFDELDYGDNSNTRWGQNIRSHVNDGSPRYEGRNSTRTMGNRTSDSDDEKDVCNDLMNLTKESGVNSFGGSASSGGRRKTNEFPVAVMGKKYNSLDEMNIGKVQERHGLGQLFSSLDQIHVVSELAPKEQRFLLCMIMDIIYLIMTFIRGVQKNSLDQEEFIGGVKNLLMFIVTIERLRKQKGSMNTQFPFREITRCFQLSVKLLYLIWNLNYRDCNDLICQYNGISFILEAAKVDARNKIADRIFQFCHIPHFDVIHLKGSQALISAKDQTSLCEVTKSGCTLPRIPWVALKKYEHTSLMEQNFEEVALLSLLKHPNVTPFLGAFIDQKGILTTVTPYMENESLLHVFKVEENQCVMSLICH
eukprot:TRINITY_DN14803_c0_g1_i1.p1 TRINITY_DN14803_c0_g1~~TRINITY_DN14803_c0_g1_i1.p1  ORF type:complete len:1019 (-),score=182.30 TRINITY_DN14803_c0_g1_i1:1364-4420(-)